MPTRSTKTSMRNVKERVREYISRHGKAPFNYRQVAAAIDAKTPALQRSVALTLAELAFDDEIVEISPGRYQKPRRATVMIGTFVRRSNGKNSVLITPPSADDGQEPEAIFVAERNSMHALNGDTVRISVAAHRRGQEPEAVVEEIIHKKEQTFIGTLKVDKHFAYLLTDSKFLATDIFIPRNKLKGGKTGDKAIVRITQWNDEDKNPRGEVLDILGSSGDNQAEMHAILAEFGLPYRYPSNVEKAALKIDSGITPEVIKSREDMRDVVTFTIDPADAKDFDDALSIRRLKNGVYEIGVHIADVTHYVHPDTLLDREAAERATSVYLVDRVVPMLPEHLSNGICSLRPDEEKLTFSCVFLMNDKAEVLDSHIARTVIRSNRRFTYDEAQQVIETGKGDFANEILTLDRLAKQLRKKRFEEGAMEFERAEVKFNLDKDGKPLGVFFKESKDANKLIEEFMLLANKTVAQTIGKPKARKTPKAFVYRVHEAPDPGKLADLSTLCRQFGYRLKTTGSPKDINKSINKMLQSLKGRGEENFLSTVAIRSMSKAIYSTVNVGHYGLAFDFYTHFTSPIRRYPDMLVHRLLDRYLRGGRSVSVDKLEEECKHCSEREQLAANAERASIKYKQVEFMRDHVGETFVGVVSGVTEWGLYVELNENLCEGLIPVRDLDDDYYDFDEKNYSLIGRRHGTVYRLGDEVTVRVARADLQRKQLDFTLVSDSRSSDEAARDRIVSVKEVLSGQYRRKKKNNRSRRRR